MAAAVIHWTQLSIALSIIKVIKLLLNFQILKFQISNNTVVKSPEVFLGKYVLRIYCKFTWEHPCRCVVSIKLLWFFIGITFLHGCSSVILLHIFRALFPKNTSGGLLLPIVEATQSVKLRTTGHRKKVEDGFKCP